MRLRSTGCGSFYDECDDVIVAMSGGKDSTVLLHLARTVAAERGRLPIKVFWLDQEAEWQGTVDYMRDIMYAPDGFNVPLLLDRKNVIVKGHTRWKAALRLGMASVPCVYTDNDEETNKLDRIADNKVQEFSLWDDGLLGTELASLNLPFVFDVGILDLRFDLPSFDAVASAVATSASDGDVGRPVMMTRGEKRTITTPPETI